MQLDLRKKKDMEIHSLTAPATELYLFILHHGHQALLSSFYTQDMAEHTHLQKCRLRLHLISPVWKLNYNRLILSVPEINCIIFHFCSKLWFFCNLKIINRNVFSDPPPLFVHIFINLAAVHILNSKTWGLFSDLFTFQTYMRHLRGMNSNTQQRWKYKITFRLL